MKKEKFVTEQLTAVDEAGNLYPVQRCVSHMRVQGLSASGIATDTWLESNGQDLMELSDGWWEFGYPPVRVRLQEPPTSA